MCITILEEMINYSGKKNLKFKYLPPIPFKALNITAKTYVKVIPQIPTNWGML